MKHDKSTGLLVIVLVTVSSILTQAGAHASVDSHQVVALALMTLAAVSMSQTPPDDLES